MRNLLIVSILAVTALSFAQQGGGRGGQRGGFGRQGNSLTGLLQRADVQGELKITEDQKTKIEAANPRRGQGGGAGGGGQRGGGAGGGGNFDPEAMRKAQQEREKAITDLLTPEQNKRLRELFIQRAGNQAVTREEIQKELGLKEDQVKKIQELTAKQREANQAIMEKVRNQEIDRTQLGELQTKNENILKEELGKVLTAEQAAKLKAMGGAPFKFVDPAITR
jgi:Spy/CpxP family protein refolding chaperone